MEDTKLSCKVKKQIFFHEKSMFTILQVEALDTSEIPSDTDVNPKDVRAKGTLRLVRQGERFIFRGKWKKDPKYGWQFVFDEFSRDVPKTEEGVIDYLSSGIFKGIGKKTAKRLVSHFGVEVLKILRENPDRLKEVRGISPAKIDQMKADYVRTPDYYDEMVVKLQPFGISPSMAVKIVDRYEKNAWEVVTKNPYQMIGEVKGIGFLTADSIAAQTGVPANSIYRLKAAAKYVMDVAINQKGHVYLPQKEFMEEIVKTLRATNRPVSDAEVAKTVLDLIEEKEDFIQEGDAVYLRSMLILEKRAAHKIKHILSQPPRRFPRSIMKMVEEVEKALNIQYSESQREAFLALEKSNILVITGGPGTGKSTILKGIIKILEDSFLRISIGMAAPTGKAAKRITEVTGREAKTIHRLLEFKPNEEGKFAPTYDEFHHLPYDVVVVDEFSMVDLPLMGMLTSALSGKVLFIMLGDVDQLPSVGPGLVLKDIIESGMVPVVRLKEIFRQKTDGMGEKTSRIVINVSHVRNGTYRSMEWGPDFFFVKAKSGEEIAEKVCDWYKRALEETSDVQILTPFRNKTVTGAESLNRRIQEMINPSRGPHTEMTFNKRVYRVGDPVMQVKNDYDKGIFNGSTGKIIEANPTMLKVRFDDLDDPLIFDRDETEELWLNYATTVHKSQGSEYDTIFFVLDTAHFILLRRSIILTGVSRAKKKVIMIGEPKALAIAVTTVKQDLRYTNLSMRLAS